MKVHFSVQEQELLQLLRKALNNEKKEIEYIIDSEQVIALAQRHTVVSFLYDITKDNQAFIQQYGVLEKCAQQVVLQSYRLLFLTKYVVNLLRDNEINCVVLKGVATAGFYPVPELRKSGDVDLLVEPISDASRLIKIMCDAGFQLSDEQHANHHTVFVSKEGIHIEIHSMLAEPFAYKRINNAMIKQTKECWKHVFYANVMGVELPILNKPYHAYELLLHMLQHFVFAGFGLKLLCDWVVIWKGDWLEEEKEIFEKLIDESGLRKFADAITNVCVKYLGMKPEKFAWEIVGDNMKDVMLRDILDAEEFGDGDENRMVMMNGSGVFSYIKEFHHQMHLNFPKTGKCFLLWPVLWILTLVRFLRNNKSVRNTTMKGILKEAKRRSDLMKQLKLFR